MGKDREPLLATTSNTNIDEIDRESDKKQLIKRQDQIFTIVFNQISRSSHSLFNWRQWFSKQKNLPNEDTDENEPVPVLQLVNTFE